MGRASGLLVALLAVAYAAGCLGLADVQPAAKENGQDGEAVAGPAGKTLRVELRCDTTHTAGALRLRWLEVQDSRCPRGATCIWEGEATVTIEVTSERLTEPRLLRLELAPGAEPGAQQVAGHQLRLLGLEPYPEASAQPARDERVAILEVLPLPSTQGSPSSGSTPGGR